MATEKLESWEFCLSRKPSRTGWDVSTTRSGYGYENAKGSDGLPWLVHRSLKEGQLTGAPNHQLLIIVRKGIDHLTYHRARTDGCMLQITTDSGQVL